jgi:hypothetical protein
MASDARTATAGYRTCDALRGFEIPLVASVTCVKLLPAADGSYAFKRESVTTFEDAEQVIE